MKRTSGETDKCLENVNYEVKVRKSVDKLEDLRNSPRK